MTVSSDYTVNVFNVDSGVRLMSFTAPSALSSVATVSDSLHAIIARPITSSSLRERTTRSTPTPPSIVASTEASSRNAAPRTAK